MWKTKATTYDENGTVVATKDTVYLNPKVIPAGGESFFGFKFVDDDKQNRQV